MIEADVELRSARLVLEPQVAAHAQEMFIVLTDPAIYAYENAPPASVPWLRERFQRLQTRCSRDGRERWLNWVLRLSSSGEAIGYVQATVYPGGDAAIAYVLGSRWWGQGLAGEAVREMMAALRARHGGRRFHAVLKAANERSLRLLQRLGFTPALPAEHPEAEVAADELLMGFTPPPV